MNKGLYIFLLPLVIFFILSPYLPVESQNNIETTPLGINLIYASGKSTLMGCSTDSHIGPFWFQTSSSWISYGFDGPTVIIINGIPTFYSQPVRIYMEGFKGVAPGSLHWGVKSSVGTRLRIMGLCNYFEIH